MARSPQPDFPAQQVSSARSAEGPSRDSPPSLAGQGNGVSAEQLRSMNWRAAGAQFYPGGAYDALREAQDRGASHRGRGPKNFVRSDARLYELVCERLTDDDYIDACDISVAVGNGEVTLQGTVPMRQQKFAVEDLVAGIAGVREVHNQLSVSDTLDYPPPNDGLVEG